MQVFKRHSPFIQTKSVLTDGDTIKPKSTIGHISGNAIDILQAERVALNFIQHLSGIATETAHYVEAVKGLPVRIVDTRKTIPGLRTLQKYAVTVGGGHNHRQNLGDGILIKDNHIAALATRGLSLSDAVWRALREAPHTLKVEVEVETLEQAHEALDAGAHILLLDNMSENLMRQIAILCKGQIITEASGGIKLNNVRAVAETGVDYISIGALTHSVRSIDISLDVNW
jgi:nicotinate-nucleotide pyrophosphorylase (carboxylating)